jgi:membrane fusion protein, multidrug efflux system
MPRIVFVLLALGALAACKEAPARPEEIRPVRTLALQAAAPETTLLFSGEVVPRIETALGFRVAGKMTERRVDLGAWVEAGQVLARLDTRDLALSERSARAAVAAAQSQLELASADLARQRVLLERGHIAQAQFDRFETQYRAAKAALDQAESQARERANQTGYAALVADASGIVTAVEAEPGQVLAIGQTVVRIARSDAREVAIGVPESQIDMFKPGAPVLVDLWVLGREPTAGLVREISGMADRATRTYRVRIAIPDAPSAYRLGMTANVRLHVANNADGFEVPLAALVARGADTIVWVLAPNSETVAERPVEIAGMRGENLLLTGALSPGDRVVTAGANLLRDGQRVRATIGHRP